MSEPAIVDSYPLTPMQQGMLFHHLQSTNPGVDIEQMVGVLRESVLAGRLRDAWQAVADRHGVLRTQYRWFGLDEPRQYELERVDVTLVEHDFRGMSLSDRQVKFDAFLFEDRMRGFDLSTAPLWRLNLFQFDENDFRFVFSYHHSLLDISVVWVVEEAFGVYDAEIDGRHVELIERQPFRRHVEWLQRHLIESRESASKYYASLLDGFDEPTTFPSLARSSDTDA
ncbi:MAG: condensation domain-containing protein, partial [Ilumatobacteraceae bacterium]